MGWTSYGQQDIICDAEVDKDTLVGLLNEEWVQFYVISTNKNYRIHNGTFIDITPDTSTGASQSLASVYSPVSNSGTGETDLLSFSIPAGKLSANGGAVRFLISGTIAATLLATKTVKVYFGSTLIFSSGGLALTSAGDWNIYGTVTRTGATAQECLAMWASSVSALASTAKNTQATETLSNALTFKVTGQGGASTQVTARTLRLWYEPTPV